MRRHGLLMQRRIVGRQVLIVKPIDAENAHRVTGIELRVNLGINLFICIVSRCFQTACKFVCKIVVDIY